MREEILPWIEDDELKLTKIHDLVCRRGIEVTYAMLRRFAIEIGFGLKKPTVRLEDPAPGQEAQAGFSAIGFMFDPVTGRRFGRCS